MKRSPSRCGFINITSIIWHLRAFPVCENCRLICWRQKQKSWALSTACDQSLCLQMATHHRLPCICLQWRDREQHCIYLEHTLSGALASVNSGRAVYSTCCCCCGTTQCVFLMYLVTAGLTAVTTRGEAHCTCACACACVCFCNEAAVFWEKPKG